MSIQIVPAEHLDISKTVPLTREGKFAQWEFQTGNWTYRHSGTYKQACFLARKFYKRNFNSTFGILYINSAVEIENPNNPQQKLPLES